MCLASFINVEGLKEKLLLLNVHAITFVPSEHLFHQLEQLKNVIDSHQGPVIFAGDFNTWDEKKTKYLLRIVKQTKLQSINYTPDIRRKFKDYPLDYVFYRGLRLKSGQVLQMGHASDHNPIEATFEVP